MFSFAFKPNQTTTNNFIVNSKPNGFNDRKDEQERRRRKKNPFEISSIYVRWDELFSSFFPSCATTTATKNLSHSLSLSLRFIPTKLKRSHAETIPFVVCSFTSFYHSSVERTHRRQANGRCERHAQHML